jgi:hypothetical protein
VERVIERVKKFKLLSGNIPLSLSPLMDQLVFVACCLVNFQEPLVKENKCLTLLYSLP